MGIQYGIYNYVFSIVLNWRKKKTKDYISDLKSTGILCRISKVKTYDLDKNKYEIKVVGLELIFSIEVSADCSSVLILRKISEKEKLEQVIQNKGMYIILYKYIHIYILYTGINLYMCVYTVYTGT